VNLPALNDVFIKERRKNMLKFLLWFILLVICWPIAILALLLYPLVWLLLLPFKIVGITIGAGLDLFKAIISFPARVLRG
jgi:hypothetical protein